VGASGSSVTSIIDKIVELHLALDRVGLPHAFGGALALAWCTRMARGTIDIDINLFVDPSSASTVYDALPGGIELTDRGRAEVARDGQTRLWWEETPLDLFFNTTPFHETVATRARVESFNGEQVPFLACRDIAVFKAFFDRPKDWVDLGEMATAGTLDYESVIGTLVVHLGGGDHRIERLRSLAVS